MAHANIGAGKVNVSGSVSEAIRDELRKLAAKSGGVGVSTYMTCLMIDAVENKRIFPNAREMKGRAQHISPRSVDPKTIARDRAKLLAQQILQKKPNAA